MTHMSLHQVSKVCDQRVVLRDVAMTVEPNDLIVVLGPSGAGKSTLLRILSGLEQPTAGTLHMNGRPANALGPNERGVAMLFQQHSLYPHMSVYRNLTFGLRRASIDPDALDRHIQNATKSLGIDHLLRRMPHELSPSQRHRVALGRAMVRQPLLFLLDEPLANIEPRLRAKSRGELVRLQRSANVPMVCVTQDAHEAMALATKIVVLHEGRVQQTGTPYMLYQQPANRFVATYIGTPLINLIPARVLEASPQGVSMRLINGSTAFACVDGSQLQVGESVEMGLRPECCEILAPGRSPQSHDLTMDAEIVHQEHLGDSNLVHLKTDNGQILVARTTAPASTGTSVIVCATPESAHVFRTDGSACTRLAVPSCTF